MGLQVYRLVYTQDRHIGDRHRDTTTVDEGKELHSQ